MNNFQAMLAALAAMASQHQQEKPIDYAHPLVEGAPIKPCCKNMGTVSVISHDCACPDKKHQGAILHSHDCNCPDRFIPMKDMSRPPEINWEGGELLELKEIGDMAVYKHSVPAPKAPEARINRFEDVN